MNKNREYKVYSSLMEDIGTVELNEEQVEELLVQKMNLQNSYVEVENGRFVKLSELIFGTGN